MNLKNLALYLVKQPKIYGHLGNSFFNQKRFNIEGSKMYFVVEQQTLFNFKIVFYLGHPYEQITKTGFIVTSNEQEFLEKYKLMLKYFHDFPKENNIVI
jgi:hypothetical protein